MTEQKQSERLPAAAEQLLSRWPDSLPSEPEFERMARAIEARLGEEPADDGWALRPALPLQPGEPRAIGGAQATDDSLSGLSLRQIAQAALHTDTGASEQTTASKTVVGARAPLESFTTERQTHAATSTGSVTTPRSAVHAEGDHTAPQVNSVSRVNVVALSSRRRDPGLQVKTPNRVAAQPPPPTAPAAPGARLVTPNAHPRRLWLWTSISVAAGTLLLVGSLFRNTTTDGSLQARAPEGPSPTAAAANADGTEVASIEPAPLRTPTSGGSARLDAEDTHHDGARPGEATRAAEAAPPPRSVEELPVARRAVRRSASTAPPQTAGAVGSDRSGSTPQRVPTATPEPEPQLVPAARTGGQPERPSIGAAQGAVGSVLGRARSCVAGQFVASKATVVFGSDGRVRDVIVTGPAQNTPAESCIASAMKGARVKPFTDESFSVRTTVRP